MRNLAEDIGIILVFVLSIFILFPIYLHAQSDGVVFWNKMENDSDNKLISEIGPDLNLAGENWSYNSAMFNNGWDNNSENSYAYANSTEVVASSREGSLAFWWVPDDDGDTIVPGKCTWFFSNGATNVPQNNTYGIEIRYEHYANPPSLQIYFLKRSATTNHVVRTSPHTAGEWLATGEWKAGDKVHIAFAWHNEPVILGEYIAALWFDGQLIHGWTEPNEGSLEGWETTNPTQPFSEILRIGDSIFPYSADEQLRGPLDNIIFWDYAKSDYSDRFIESPLPTTIDDILKFFDNSVENDELYGLGTGWLAELRRLCLMRQLLVIAGGFIEHDRINGACFRLQLAHKRCDGEPWPRDFVEGPATEDIAEMIVDLMENMACE